MEPSTAAARLLIDGVVAVPDVLSAPDVASMAAAFERRAAELGKRWLDWDQISLVPELVAWIAHPHLMPIVDAFARHFGEEAVFANSAGIRDALTDPDNPTLYNPPNLRSGNVGWHDDVMGMKNPNAAMLQPTLTTLMYLDETFEESGAYCAALGSHHLASATPEGKPILAKRDTVLNNCALRAFPVKPGTVILHRAHNWHGVVPTRQRRRLMIQTFTTRAHYDLQEGHTQLSDATLALLPPERHRYVMSYATATGA